LISPGSPYTLLARIYDGGWSEYSDYIYELVRQVERESRRTFHRICDVACGTGLLLQKLLNDEIVRDLSGFDISPAMLEIAEERLPGVPLRQGDLVDGVPFSGPFDLITTVYDSLNYVMTADGLGSFFTRCRKVVSGDGLLLLDINTRELYQRRDGEIQPRLIDGLPFRQRLHFHPGSVGNPGEAVTVFSFPDGEELHRQRPWEVDETEDLLGTAGWRVLDALDVIDEDDQSPSGKVVLLAVPNV
jgi:SAM-dependent methyltransferase